MTDDALTLPEEIMILVLNERDGSLLEETEFPYAIAAAALAELIRRGRVDLEPGSVHPLVTVVDDGPTGDPVLDDVLGQLVDATRRTTATRWVGRLAEDSELRLRVARQLCRKGVLDEHEGRVRLIFRRTVYADLEPGPEDAVNGRVREAVFGEGPVDTATAVLVGLANASGVLSHVLDPAELLAHHDRLASLLDRAGDGRSRVDGPSGNGQSPADGKTEVPAAAANGRAEGSGPRERFRGTAPALVAATRTAVLQGAAPAA